MSVGDCRRLRSRGRVLWLGAAVALAGPAGAGPPGPSGHAEHPVGRPMPAAALPRGRPAHVERSGYVSVQVNVDAAGNNIFGDAASEPSLAQDPAHPNRFVIGWRQFNNAASPFRQAGHAYSHDGGHTWVADEVLEPGVFRSDPVLDASADGTFYYYSIRCAVPGCGSVFRSGDGGRTWAGPVFALGSDKTWFVADRSQTPWRGALFAAWLSGDGLARSTDGGLSFHSAGTIDVPWIPTMSVAPDGALYIVGLDDTRLRLLRIDDAGDASRVPQVSFERTLRLGRGFLQQGSINGVGLTGQAWVVADPSDGPTAGNVYVVAPTRRLGTSSNLNVFIRTSADRGVTFGPSVKINDDPNTPAVQWFAAVDVAPNGRIDVAWYDTREDPDPIRPRFSAIYYASSMDGGTTWTPNVAVSPPFDHTIRDPSGKLGDYTQLRSDNLGASLAYTATFNGEPDVWFVRIGEFDCNGNGQADSQDIAGGISTDFDGDGVPDECECLGDLNDDLSVDVGDLALLLAAAGTCDGDPAFATAADLNGDGCVDLTDLSLLLMRFGAQCPQ